MPASPQPPVVFLMGPSCSCKTALAVELVQRWPLEIINVDSALVYRGLEIGAAKPEPDVLAKAPHRLLGFRDPAEPYSAADFRTDALREIAAIHAAGRVPLLVGGTMLYFRALRDGLADMPPADETVRARLTEEAGRLGWPALHARLAEVDPDTAARLKPNDRQRLQRALEVYELTGVPFSQWQRQQTHQQPWYNVLTIGLWMERSLLYERINRRVDAMLEQGLVEEVAGLLAQGYDESLPSMQGLGYKEIIAYLKGRWTLEEAVTELKKRTRRFAKRQYTWFQRQHDVHWFQVGEKGWVENFPEIHRLVAGKFYTSDEYT